jgi:hypothetical protein
MRVCINAIAATRAGLGFSALSPATCPQGGSRMALHRAFIAAATDARAAIVLSLAAPAEACAATRTERLEGFCVSGTGLCRVGQRDCEPHAPCRATGSNTNAEATPKRTRPGFGMSAATVEGLSEIPARGRRRLPRWEVFAERSIIGPLRAHRRPWIAP